MTRASKHPVLPPSDDFAAYLVSHYHLHRMNVARQATLRRMNNFHPTEVYPAISEALGVMAALGEFYAGPVDDRDTAGLVAGDPSPRRPVMIEETSSVELPTGKTLQPQQVRIVRILSEGAPLDLADLMKRAGSKTVERKAMTASIRNLRTALADSGIEVETASDGRVLMDGASCVLAQAIVGVSN